MSVDLVYQDQYLSTGRTIELVAPQEISVSLESVDLGVSLDLSVSSQIAVELAISQSLVSLELAMTPIITDVKLSNPRFTRTDGVVTRVDYDGGIYKIITWTGGIVTTTALHTSEYILTKTFNYFGGLLESVTELVS